MTNEIRHSFQIACKPDRVVKALTEANEIQKWWTTDATVKSGHAVLRWKEHDWTVELTMSQDDSNPRVVWHCTRSNMQDTNAWEGSSMLFTLRPKSDGTQMDFLHLDYQDSHCFEACTEGWKYFLGTSLKSYLETGTGTPYCGTDPIV